MANTFTLDMLLDTTTVRCALHECVENVLEAAYRVAVNALLDRLMVFDHDLHVWRMRGNGEISVVARRILTDGVITEVGKWWSEMSQVTTNG